MAEIDVLATCSKCKSAIGKVVYEPAECREDHIGGVIIHSSSSIRPKFCKYCGARFNSIVWLKPLPKRQYGYEG